MSSAISWFHGPGAVATWHAVIIAAAVSGHHTETQPHSLHVLHKSFQRGDLTPRLLASYVLQLVVSEFDFLLALIYPATAASDLVLRTLSATEGLLDGIWDPTVVIAGDSNDTDVAAIRASLQVIFIVSAFSGCLLLTAAMGNRKGWHRWSGL